MVWVVLLIWIVREVYCAIIFTRINNELDKMEEYVCRIRKRLQEYEQRD